VRISIISDQFRRPRM